MAASIYKMISPENTVSKGTNYFRFLWKKYISVFPYHMVAFAFVLVVDCIIEAGVSLTKLLNVIPGFFLIQRSGISFYNLNGVEWYISAMLIAMAFILPVAVKFKDVYFKVLAPLSALLIYGWLVHEFGTISGTTEWTPVGYRCFWRAIAGLNLGAFVFWAVSQMKKIDFTKKEVTFARVSSVVLWVISVVYAFVYTDKQYEVINVFVMTIALMLTMTFASTDGNFMQSKFVMFLGKFSLPLYLNQIAAIKIVKACFGSVPQAAAVALVLVIDVVFSLICQYAGDALMRAFLKSKLNKAVMGIK